jgi:hypothetical protein
MLSLFVMQMFFHVGIRILVLVSESKPSLTFINATRPASCTPRSSSLTKSKKSGNIVFLDNFSLCQNACYPSALIINPISAHIAFLTSASIS